ncbi:30S ribosomal protein S1 [Aerococcaceae bacterium NML210727]|nr:30S ribosomal protein S1 [Aerococcaceae bacterium NML210727]MCW6654101.1 30S ribosomal protein S1 [Aerococcaceae bacterium NML201296]MCW6675260.1 30S ribosomal protein S1 [Aerococcaceae bacterium NML171108]MCW6677339.1 30S ribosomal protein S1 [Aerococcaceae bacterium NML180378]MCW6682652.1 30S ribosomal protein S1 [Aerococcaceae bacterium NML160702]
MTEFVNEQEVTVEEGAALTSMADALDSVLDIKVGDIVKGDVLAFDDNQVRVAIKESGGLEGVVPRNELSATPFDALSDVVSIGDEIELVVLKPIKDKENGNYLLSKKRVDAKKVWAELQEKANNQETLTAPVKEAVKGGLVVDAGVRGFVPASMVEEFYVEDLSAYKGQTLEFVIVEVEPSENRLILSHKEIARRERDAKREEALAKLEEDAVVEGKVARLTNFGAFIDLGGVDGLVHISRISHQHIAKPSDALTVGDTVNVKVLSIDKEAGRVSLSIKDTLEGPWDNIAEKAPEGAVLPGVVKRLADFGAFVEVFPGVEGLVHISQISHEHIATPQEKLTEGQEIEVKVLSSNQEEQRLSLSIKALIEKPVQEVVEKPKKESAPKPRKSSPAKEANSFVPEADTGFTLGDVLGSALEELNTEA